MAVKIRNPKFGTADFVKFIRSNYTPPKDTVYEPSVISHRSENVFSVAKTCDSFLDNYKRRQENRQGSGFFCPQCVPYQPLGELVLDANRLVLQSLEGSVNEQAVKNHEKSKDPRATPFSGEDNQKSPGQPDDDAKKDWEKRKFASQAAGMQHIRVLLHEAERRVTAVKAGQGYELNVLQCKSDKHRARAIEEDHRGQNESMSMNRLSSHFLLDNIPTDGVAFGDDVFTGAGSFGRKFTLTKNDEILMVKPKLPELERKQNPRKIKSFRKRLRCIYNILCMMCNVKTKMLRQRTPLNHPTVKVLQKDPYVRGLKGRRSGPRRSVSVGVKILQSQPSNELPLISQTGRDSISQSGRSLLMSRQGMQSRQSCFKSTTEGGSGATASIGVNREQRRRLLIPGKYEREETPSRLENWEDLLNVSTKKHNRVPRKLPPWFPSLTAAEKNSKPDSEKTNDTENERRDVNFLHRFRTDMVMTREAILSSAKFANTKIESEKLPKFRMKMALLVPRKMRPLWEQQRKVLDDVNKKDIKGVECVQDKYPLWYEDLLAECSNLYVDDDRDISKIMLALEMFAKEDIQAMPNAKEKLCLVTLSLPVFQICTSPMQHALKFILAEVLQLKPEVLEEWLKYRKLYVI